MPHGSNLMGMRLKPSPKICKSCLRQQRLSSTAAANSPEISEDPHISTPHPISIPSTAYKISASVLLSRPPLLTRDLTLFEKAYFLYQRRLNERLSLPFTRYFYYQKGTAADVEWQRKIDERQTPARDIGFYDAYDKEVGWNDELLVGAKESEPVDQIEALVRDAESEIKQEEQRVKEREDRDEEAEQAETTAAESKKKKEKFERPMPRVTEADKVGDLRSLNRALTRTLYLVVKGRGQWRFPSSVLEGKESLHTAAERILIQSSGPNMNTWVVGNMPIGHHKITYPQPLLISPPPAGISEQKQVGEKIFYMKARIMAGQANLKGNKFGLKDFMWLAKEEIQERIDKNTWNGVRNCLISR